MLFNTLAQGGEVEVLLIQDLIQTAAGEAAGWWVSQEDNLTIGVCVCAQGQGHLCPSCLKGYRLGLSPRLANTSTVC